MSQKIHTSLILFVLISHMLSGAASLGYASDVKRDAAPVTKTTLINSQTYPLRPKLVVVLVIDQFRADYLTRFRPQFLKASGPGNTPGGFNFLIENGAYYPYAEYDILQCMTGPGHATISTGAYPYQHGISLNYWYDPEKKAPVYCVEDETSPTVPAPSDSTKPLGLSPRNLMTTTLGDELKNAGYPSQVVSLALKDRAAILMGGHRSDLTLWFDAKTRQWATSKYYLRGKSEIPAWVSEYNQEWRKKAGTSVTWNSEFKPSGLTDESARFPGAALKSYGPQFPHRLSTEDKNLVALPFGVQMTTDLAIKAVEAMKLGQGKATDILWVSLSSHDYMGHAFGPNSREMEEMTLQEDRILAQFFGHLKKTLKQNFDDTWFVLTADHGVPSSPEWLSERGVPTGRFEEQKAMSLLNEQLNKKFGSPGKDRQWISYTRDLNFFFDLPLFAEKNVNRREIEEASKTVLQSLPGVARVISRTDALQANTLPGRLSRITGRTHHEGRMGDLIVVPKTNVITFDDAAEHLTSNTYDRTVPLILSGKPFRTGIYAQSAGIVDIAPTLAWLLGIIPPASSEGRVLSEALATAPVNPNRLLIKP